jgi:hypothetical protein
LATSIADLVAEALSQIESGELTVAQAANRYNPYWAEMRPAIELALKLNEVSQPPVISSRPFTPLNKAAGWEVLRAQMTPAPVPAARPQPQAQAVYAAHRVQRPQLTFWQKLERAFNSFFGKLATGAVMTVMVAFLLAGIVGNAQPGDWFYQAKLGWEYGTELVSLAPDDKARAANRYAANRLQEIERMAFARNSSAAAEAQGQYLRALEASQRYAGMQGFSAFGEVYTDLSQQRDRLVMIQQYEYALGTRSQINLILGRLDYTRNYILAPNVPGAQPTAPPTVKG